MKKARTIFEQTGWKRPHPQTICQEHAVLLEIEEYDFDGNDRKFLDYFKARTGIVPFPRYFDLSDPDILDDKARRIFFGRLQDCWELYREDSGAPAASISEKPKPLQLSLF